MDQMKPWDFLMKQGLKASECKCLFPFFARELARALWEFQGVELKRKECMQEGFVAPLPALELAFDRLGNTFNQLCS